jgi:hypothetical protein
MEDLCGDDLLCREQLSLIWAERQKTTSPSRFKKQFQLAQDAWSDLTSENDRVDLAQLQQAYRNGGNWLFLIFSYLFLFSCFQGWIYPKSRSERLFVPTT